MESNLIDEAAQTDLAAKFLVGGRQTRHEDASPIQEPLFRTRAEDNLDKEAANLTWELDSTDSGEPSKGLALGLLVSVPLWSAIGAAIYLAAR